MKPKLKKLQESLYPKVVIRNLDEDILEGYTVALSFEEDKGVFNCYFHEVCLKIQGGKKELNNRIKEYVEIIMLQGEPNRDPVFIKEGYKIKTPFYKKMNKNEIKNQFRKCSILYTR